MDVGLLLRCVRQAHAWSQQELARAAGVSSSAVADWEAGRRSPRLAVLQRLLDLAEVDLVLAPAPVPPTVELVQHLRDSTTVRLFRAAEGRGTPRVRGRHGVLWDALWELVGVADVVLDGRSALPVWLPGHPLGPRPPVQARALEHVRLPAGPTVDEQLAVAWRDDLTREQLLRPGLVRVAVRPRRGVWVPAPMALSLDPRCAAEAEELRAAAALVDAPRDDAGRRAPAHRSLQEERETEHLLRLQTLARVHPDRLPSPQDSRGWRVGAQVGVDGWLRERGLPPARDPRRRQ